MATLLRMALTPYVPDVVFPTEAVLGCIADDLAEGRHGDAVDKVKAGLLAGNPSASAGNPPALARSPEEEVTGFVFVPGYAGVPPTPPSSPCPLEERSEGEEPSLPSTGALIGEGFACPPSSPAPSEWPVWVDTDKLHARITAPCSSPAAGAGGQWDAQRYPVNAIRLAPQASYEVVLCGAAMEDD